MKEKPNTSLWSLSEQDQKQIESVTKPIVERSTNVVITTHEQYVEVASYLRQIKAASKELDSIWDRVCTPINQGLTALRSLLNPSYAKLTAAEKAFKHALKVWDDQQEAKRIAEQKRLDELAAKERQKAEEAAAKAAAAAAEARAAGDDRKAERLEDKAAAKIEQAQQIVAPVVQKATPTVSGLSFREKWICIVEDKKALIAAVAAGTVPTAALQVDQSWLNKQADQLRKEFNYPGCKAKDTRTVASSSK